MKRGENRAQVSVFIIFAIILVIAGSLAYVINRNVSNARSDNEFFSSAEIKPGFDKLKNSISDCMSNTGSDSLELIGIQGGYYNKPKEYFDLGWAFIPYYYYQGEFLMPTNDEIENQLSMYVNENIGNCIDSIQKEDFEVVFSKAKTRADIEEDDVKFTIDMPVSISKEGNTISLDLKKNPIVLDSKLYEMLEIAKYISDSHKEDSNRICITCISDMARERNLYVDMINFDETSKLFVISQNLTSSMPYNFEFLNMYLS